MKDERRQHSRIAFHSRATLAFADHSLDVVVLDLSLKGALVRLPADVLVETNAICILHVHLNETEMNDQISMEARVAHCEGRYAGLLCMAIDIDSVTHLRRLVELNLGDPNLLERELTALIAD